MQTEFAEIKKSKPILGFPSLTADDLRKLKALVLHIGKGTAVEHFSSVAELLTT